jgi:hypothetical protein
MTSSEIHGAKNGLSHPRFVETFKTESLNFVATFHHMRRSRIAERRVRNGTGGAGASRGSSIDRDPTHRLGVHRGNAWRLLVCLSRHDRTEDGK